MLYYVLFRFVITRWNLRTPGREDDDAEGAVQATGAVDTTDDARPDASAAEAASVRRAAADTAEAGTPSRTGASGGGGTA